MNTGAQRGSHWALVLAPCLIAAAMLAWSFGRWPDVLIDFGGEVYVPWRISAGDVLYRDLAYFTGPLSPHVNALVFTLFGASLRALFVANLGVLGAITWLLYRLLRAIGGPWSASAGTCAFLAVCAFGQLQAIGNYNYVAPYSHETTHGALLALGALACLERWLAAPRARWLAALGVLLGLAFLTKVEVFLALGAALLLGVVLAASVRKTGVRACATHLAVLAGCALVPVVLAMLLLAGKLGFDGALRGALGAWLYVFDERITALPFYTRVMGTDRLGANVQQMGLWALIHAVVGLAVVGPALWLRGRAAGRAAAWIAAMGFGALLVGLRLRGEVWAEVFRPLPLAAGAALAWALASAFRGRARGQLDARAILRASFALYALVLLAKMLFNARLQHYGFALAMPAFVLAIAVAVDWIPDWVAARGGQRGFARGAALGVVAAVVVAQLEITRGFFAFKTVDFGAGADKIRTDPRGPYLDAALRELDKRCPPGATLAVLPEGVLLNYMTRRRTPARFINYMPPELLMFGEAAMRAELERAPPDAIVLVHKDTSEYGVRAFGKDYARELDAWIRAHYRPVATFGQVPFAPGTQFGVQVLQPVAAQR